MLFISRPFPLSWYTPMIMQAWTKIFSWSGKIKWILTQPARDLTETPRPETPGDLQGTNREIDDLMKKVFFRCNSPCFTHPLLFFTGKTNIQKFWMGTPTGVCRNRMRDVPGTKWWDDLGTSVGRQSYMFSKFNSETY